MSADSVRQAGNHQQVFQFFLLTRRHLRLLLGLFADEYEPARASFLLRGRLWKTKENGTCLCAFDRANEGGEDTTHSIDAADGSGAVSTPARLVDRAAVCWKYGPRYDIYCAKTCKVQKESQPSPFMIVMIVYICNLANVKRVVSVNVRNSC